MTKLYLASLALLLMMACSFLTLFGPTSVPTPTPTSTRAYIHAPTRVPTRMPIRVIVVAFDSLYLRAGPGMQYAASNEVLRWGDRLTFEDECRIDARGWNWLRVRVDERSGWVAQKYITPTVCR